MNVTRFHSSVGASLAIVMLAMLASCGGGSGDAATPQSSASSMPGSTASVSSGVVTAFGSVFVNRHEFNTGHAQVIDDDTGLTASNTNGLDVGMVVSVHGAVDSTMDAPDAAEIHFSPLVRGFVDSSNTAAGTLVVMGQTIQLTASTAYVDHRACTSAASSPCAAIANQAGLSVTSGAVPGSYLAVHGFLFSGASGIQIIATYIGIDDYSAGKPFKVEGQITSVHGTSTVSIGAETVDLSGASCAARGSATSCAALAVAGNVIAARGATAPVGTSFAPTNGRTAALLPQTPNATVEVEGRVSSVSGTSTFIVRGITVNGSALPLGQIPSVGDDVELSGTIAADGTTVVATSITSEHRAAAARVVLVGPLTGVAAGPTTATYSVTVLGQTAAVAAMTRIADRTVDPRPTFNIANFQTYLSGKTAFVVMSALVDSGGNLQATDFAVIHALPRNLAAVAGPADAAPVAGSPSYVSVHGVTIAYTSTIPLGAVISKGTYLLGLGTLSVATIDTTVSGGSLLVRQLSRPDDLDLGM